METAERTLDTTDRCDRCGSQAYVRIFLDNGFDLLFCGHHRNEYSKKIEEVALIIQDETDRMK